MDCQLETETCVDSPTIRAENHQTLRQTTLSLESLHQPPQGALHPHPRVLRSISHPASPVQGQTVWVQTGGHLSQYPGGSF